MPQSHVSCDITGELYPGLTLLYPGTRISGAFPGIPRLGLRLFRPSCWSKGENEIAKTRESAQFAKAAQRIAPDLERVNRRHY
jgi:hypothetical protein